MSNSLSHDEAPESVDDMLRELDKLDSHATVFRARLDRHASPFFIVMPEQTDRELVWAMSHAALLVANMWVHDASRRHLLPTDEQAVWESVGARFDRSAEPAAWAATATAFVQLLNASFVGNEELASALGVDKSRVSQLVSERSVYAFDDPDRRRHFPRWQFVERRPVQGLKTVLARLDPELHPLTVTHWMTTPHVDLNANGEPASPIEWLATGGSPERVAELASDL